MVLDHRARLAANPIGRRSILLVVLGVAGAPALLYVAIESRVGFDELMLLAAGGLGLLVPPHRLVAAMAPAWLLAPLAAEAFVIACGATMALGIGLLLRFVGGALQLRRAVGWLALFAAALSVSLLYPVTAGSTPLSPWHDLAGVLIGLAVAASALSAPPDPAVMAKTIAVAGAVVAGIILAGGALAAGRLVGASLNANYLGMLLALPCIAAIGLAWHARQPAWLIAAAPGAVALVQTQSRGALVAIAAGAGYLMLSKRSWPQRALVIAAGALLAVLFGDVLMELLLGGRSTTELDANSTIRAEVLRLALQVAVEHPLRGIGYGMFPPYAAAAPEMGIFINTHNEYARLVCEAGMPASALFAVLLVRAMRGGGDEAGMVLRAIVVVYATGLLFGNFLSNIFVSVPFWLALGCLLAGCRNRKAEGMPSWSTVVPRSAPDNGSPLARTGRTSSAPSTRRRSRQR
ncbi:O-antigen ligase family protein [Paractinoplanes rishiriensis]|uniref:O-antigen ligase-related domain-containing protein n=1 Tax=Paractinoplanes rishiriensis TaxID=1050105 RepID=A0A919JU04_9ACTN|nr:O-antigen ligase family protein [Actinoplanes rishiriensis]GIE93168.1 hypothetical protein Ari01nite_06330 [Actinoplanes rishiriensis]